MATYHDTCPWAAAPEESPTSQSRKYSHPQSSVQNLLYGGNYDGTGKPVTPVKSGKKSVMPATSRPSPYAQWDLKKEEMYNQEFVPRAAKAKGAIEDVASYKVGGGGFDPAVYRTNIENNFYNRKSSHMRAHGDGNLLCHQGQEMPSVAPHASGEKVGYMTPTHLGAPPIGTPTSAIPSDIPMVPPAEVPMVQ